MRRYLSPVVLFLLLATLIMSQGCTAAQAAVPPTVTRAPSQAPADPLCDGRYCTTPTPGTPVPPAAPSASPTPVDPANLPTVPGNAQPYAVPGGWRLVLNDNFDGSSLNTRVWQPNWFGDTLTSVTQYVNSEENQCFDPAQLKVAGGELDITAITKDCPDTAGKSAGFPITSGMINSYPRFTFTYGVAEIRMWVDGPDENHCNNWVSFWLNGEPGDGRQEYDVAECLAGRGSAQGNQFEFHLNPQNEFGGSSTSQIANGWHVFSIDWQPDGATVFYDQTLIGSITDNVYARPMYLIVENAVKAADAPIVPNTMRIDYVRVWQAAK